MAKVGGDPGTVPDNYYARDATAAITNYSGGKLYLFHDAEDNIVKPVHSTRINTAMGGIGNCALYLSQSVDSIRYSHGHALDGAAQLDIESKAMNDILTAPAWTVPASGTVTVIGYLVTKRFSIWLNAGLDAAATVVYDTAAGTYTVTPLTSNAIVAVTITQGALTASGNTNGETLFTVA